MANETLARRYAMAVFSLAQQNNAVDKIGNELQSVADTIHRDPESHEFFVSPIVDRNDKEQALAKTFAGRVDDVALHTVLLLVRKRRESLLRELIAQYHVLEQQARGAEPLTIATAKPLGADELRSIVARLEAAYGKTFDVEQRVDPALIGGVQITMGDKRIDGTVAGRLESLSRTLVGP